MAIAISESVAVLRPIPPAASAPRAAAMAFAIPSPGGPRLNLSSKFKGLRVDGTAVTAKRRPGRRVGAVVCDASNTAVGAKEVTKDTWDSLVLGSNLPAIVEFWAPWCGPCKLIHPVIDELAKEYAGKLKVYKLNTDESPDTATKYGVRSIPTVMLFKDAEKKDAVIGAVSKSTLVACIDRYL